MIHDFITRDVQSHDGKMNHKLLKTDIFWMCLGHFEQEPVGSVLYNYKIKPNHTHVESIIYQIS